MPQSTIYLAERPGTPRSESPPPAVATYRLARLFAGSPALVDVGFRVDAGSTVALTGPNGAGKSTLLRLVATAIRPSFGRLEILGVDAGRRPELLRPWIAYLSHSSGLYEDLTLTENLEFAAVMRRMPRREAGRRTRDAMDRVGLAAFRAERVRTFSAGMRRRAALARLLLGTPRLVLLDEPYAALDADGVLLVDELLREWRAAGATCLVASHAEERLSAVADGVARLESGVLVELSGSGVTPTTDDSSLAAPQPVRGAA